MITWNRFLQYAVTYQCFNVNGDILLFQIQYAKGHRVVLATKFETMKILLFQI